MNSIFPKILVPELWGCQGEEFKVTNNINTMSTWDWVLPYIRHKGMCRSKGYGFCAFQSKKGYTLCPFWS